MSDEQNTRPAPACATLDDARASIQTRALANAHRGDVEAGTWIGAGSELLVEVSADRDEWKAAAQRRMTTGFAFGIRAQQQGEPRVGKTPAWLAGFDFAAEMFGVVAT